MSSRRGSNEGTITKRADGRWEARITLENGKRKCFYARSRQEVAGRLSEALRDQAKGLPIVGEKQTLAQYLASWLEIAKLTIRASTWWRYEELTRVHILPTLGSLPLSRLTAQHANALYAAKLGEGLSPTTVRYIHVTLHRALGEALRLGLVQRNVTDFASPPRKSRRKMQVLSPEQARMLLRAAADDPLEALYLLAFTTGMRQGELLSLKWTDVDLEAAHVQVRSSLRKGKEGFVFSEPKTSSSRRKVALTATAVVALERHRERQLEQRMAYGPLWQNHDLVFPDTLGMPFNGVTLLRREFVPLLKRAGLPMMRFHDLRHTAATLMLLKGVHPKIVSEMLGHASVSITLDLYSHVLPNMQREAAETMDRLLRE